MPIIENVAPVHEKKPPIKKSRKAGDLIVYAPNVTPKESNAEVAQFFHERVDVVGLAVVEDGIPIGLINRNVFMEGFARPFARDIFSRKSCIAYMDKAPLIVDSEMSVEELSASAIMYGEKVLKDGYIITENGIYRGIGTGFDLISTLSEMQAAKNHIIMESINYASVIQRSYMHHSDIDLAASLNDYFLWWQPRDVVGGDCYFFRRYEEGLFFSLIDCTGHGVPGAFMTLIVMSALESALKTMDPSDPAAILRDVNIRIKDNLGQTAINVKTSTEVEELAEGDHNSDDGFDGVFGWFARKTNQVTFAGAKTSMLAFHVGSVGVETIDGDRMGVGYLSTPDDFVWKNQVFNATPGTRLYVTTDGIIDQIGGPKNIAFGKKRLREIIRMIGHEPMSKQMSIIQEQYREYQGENSRRDDVSIFGFRVE